MVADQPVRSFHSPEYQLLIDVIIEARKATGLDQEELSHRLRQSRMYIYKCESLRRRVDAVEVVEISAALGLDRSELLQRWLARIGSQS